MRTPWFSTIVALVAVSALPVFAQTAAFPNKPLRMVIPYPAGGPTDILARHVAADMGVVLGQQVVADNRPGANGVIGSEFVARAAPDGYTMLMTGIDQHIGNVLMYKSVPYDALNDFAPVTQVNSVPMVLVINPSVAANNVAELVKIARAQPGKISYASSSIGSLSHLGGEQFRLMAGIDITHIPYKGGGPALNDVVGGQVPMYFSGVNAALPFIKAGRLRALAVTGTSRLAVLPDVPTVAETPEFKGYEATLLFGLWVPAKTPSEIIAKLQQSVARAIQTPKFQQMFDADGSGAPIGNTPAEMAATISAAGKRLPAIIKASGIKPE